MATYEAIATTTVGSGGTATIAFSSIPATYTDLTIQLSYRATVTGPTDGYISFNGSTSSFTWTSVYGTGSSAVSGSNTVNNAVGQVQGAGATALTFASVELYMPNYANSNSHTFTSLYVTENNATLAYAGLVAGKWAVANAINSITISLGSGNIAEFSTATLYGIKKN